MAAVTSRLLPQRSEGESITGPREGMGAFLPAPLAELFELLSKVTGRGIEALPSPGAMFRAAPAAGVTERLAELMRHGDEPLFHGTPVRNVPRIFESGALRPSSPGELPEEVLRDWAAASHPNIPAWVKAALASKVKPSVPEAVFFSRSPGFAAATALGKSPVHEAGAMFAVPRSRLRALGKGPTPRRELADIKEGEEIVRRAVPVDAILEAFLLPRAGSGMFPRDYAKIAESLAKRGVPSSLALSRTGPNTVLSLSEAPPPRILMENLAEQPLSNIDKALRATEDWFSGGSSKASLLDAIEDLASLSPGKFWKDLKALVKGKGKGVKLGDEP